MTETPTPKIYAALAAVMAEVGVVGKTRKNLQQGYQFRGIDDVLAATQELMAKHKVLCVPVVLEREREYVDTKNGGKMASVRLLVRHTFYAEDGSSAECVTLGEAMDSGDKASNKAMSAALKYALVETLLIPTYEPDRDTETASPQLADAKPRAAAKPAQPPDALEKEKALILAAAVAARDVADLEALKPRFNALPKPDRDELGPKLTARKAELAKVTS